MMTLLTMVTGIGMSATAIVCCLAIAADEHRADAALSNELVAVERHGANLHLRVLPPGRDKKQVVIPRLCAPMRSMRWQDHPDVNLKFTPEQTEWVFAWDEIPESATVIEIEFDAEPLLPDDLKPAQPAGDGSILLPAYQATTHGEKLRYEPQSFKNTVGYWTVATDFASWKLQVDQPGTYSVAVLQGLGDGQGGSEAVITLHRDANKAASIPFHPIETGHFQNFRWVHLGNITLTETGEHELRMQPARIARNALVDVRAFHLVRQAK